MRDRHPNDGGERSVIPRIIHQIWVGPKPLPHDYAPLIEKIKSTHAGWEHRLWTEESLPDGMIRTEWRDKLRFPAERADLLRLELLYKYGGVYLDVDFDVHKPLDQLLHIAPIVIADLKPGRVNNAFMAAVAGHPLIHAMIMEAKPAEQFGLDKGACGPFFVDRMLAPHKESDQVKILPPASFYPSRPEDMSGSYAVHIGHRSWKDNAGWKKAALLAEKRLRAANERIHELEAMLGNRSHANLPLRRRLWRLLPLKTRRRLMRYRDVAQAKYRRRRKRIIKASRVARFNTAAWGARTLGVPLHRNYLPHLLNKLSLTGAGAEVGVKRGIYSEIILSRWEGKKLYLVDPWEEQNDESYVDRANVDQERHDTFYNEALERLGKFNGRFEIVRDYSLTAAADIPDESLDFVYIDARHDHDSVLEDLRAWEPKVKVGGVIAGHDYLQGVVNGTPFGVRSAVRQYMKERNYPRFALRRTWEPWPSFYFVRAPAR